MIIHLIAEGYTEEAVALKLLPFCGHEVGTVYGMRGCIYIHNNAIKYRHLATDSSAVLVLTDFRDAKKSCVVEALQKFVFSDCPCPHRNFLFRFAVNEIESWLLADREGMAEFIGIPVSRLPLQPENELFPKKRLVSLARLSRKKRIREGLAPLPGHCADVGPEYMNLLYEFIADHWDIEAAMCYAKSLKHCVYRLRDL